jgi:hypothetical protein
MSANRMEFCQTMAIDSAPRPRVFTTLGVRRGSPSPAVIGSRFEDAAVPVLRGQRVGLVWQATLVALRLIITRVETWILSRRRRMRRQCLAPNLAPGPRFGRGAALNWPTKCDRHNRTE